MAEKYTFDEDAVTFDIERYNGGEYSDPGFDITATTGDGKFKGDASVDCPGFFDKLFGKTEDDIIKKGISEAMKCLRENVFEYNKMIDINEKYSKGGKQA